MFGSVHLHVQTLQRLRWFHTRRMDAYKNNAYIYISTQAVY